MVASEAVNVVAVVTSLQEVVEETSRQEVVEVTSVAVVETVDHREEEDEVTSVEAEAAAWPCVEDHQAVEASTCSSEHCAV